MCLLDSERGVSRSLLLSGEGVKFTPRRLEEPDRRASLRDLSGGTVAELREALGSMLRFEPESVRFLMLSGRLSLELLDCGVLLGTSGSGDDEGRLTGEVDVATRSCDVVSCSFAADRSFASSAFRRPATSVWLIPRISLFRDLHTADGVLTHFLEFLAFLLVNVRFDGLLRLSGSRCRFRAPHSEFLVTMSLQKT